MKTSLYRITIFGAVAYTVFAIVGSILIWAYTHLAQGTYVERISLGGAFKISIWVSILPAVMVSLIYAAATTARGVRNKVPNASKKQRTLVSFIAFVCSFALLLVILHGLLQLIGHLFFSDISTD